MTTKPDRLSTLFGSQTPTSGDTRTLRTVGKLIALAITALLAVLSLSFILLDWLRLVPGPVGELAGSYFSVVLTGAGYLDSLLAIELFAYPFMLRAISTGVLVGVVGPLVGTFLVHRQMALIGETLAHTAFAGVAFGMLVVAFAGGFFGTLISDEATLLVVALVVSVIGALGLQWLTAHTDNYGDVPISIVLTGSFALGTVVISLSRGFVSLTVDIEDFLFGSLAIVTVEGARIVGLLSIVVTALVITHYKQFLLVTFDEQAARAAQVDVRFYNALLVVMTAVVVVGAMQILGVILVAGLLVIPVAAASQVAFSFRETMILSILLGQFSVLSGLFVAIAAGLPPGGSIILVAIGCYLLAVIRSNRATSAVRVS